LDLDKDDSAAAADDDDDNDDSGERARHTRTPTDAEYAAMVEQLRQRYAYVPFCREGVSYSAVRAFLSAYIVRMRWPISHDPRPVGHTVTRAFGTKVRGDLTNSRNEKCYNLRLKTPQPPPKKA
jgi:hypothetical protein